MRLDALLRPRSVAILGASERPSIGRSLIEALDTIGFRGAIYPINPRYETLLGRKCYASVAELPPASTRPPTAGTPPRGPDPCRPAPSRAAGAPATSAAAFAGAGAEAGRERG